MAVTASTATRSPGAVHHSAGRHSIALASTDDLTDAGIQAALEAGGATDVHIQKDPTDGTALDNGTITSVQLGGGGLPQDLFTVRGTWADYVQNGKVYVDFYGRWNYNDEYIGSGNPYDAAGIIVGGFNKECWTNVSTGLKTQSNDGTQTGLANKKSSGHQKTIFNVFDDTKAFQLQTDMGFAWIEMRRDTLSCDARKIGRFYHEHNQNGDGGWTASLNVGNFTLTYDEAPKALQKGTKVKYYDKY